VRLGHSQEMASTLMTWKRTILMERNKEHENEDNRKLQNACNSPDSLTEISIGRLERLEDRRIAQMVFNIEPEVRPRAGRPEFR
jgi:hypothetical protein